MGGGMAIMNKKFWLDVLKSIIIFLSLAALTFIGSMSYQTYEIVKTAKDDHHIVVRLDSTLATITTRGIIDVTTRVQKLEELRRDDSTRNDRQFQRIQKGISEIKIAVTN